VGAWGVPSGVADSDLGSGAILIPGSGIRNEFFRVSDTTHVSMRFVKKIWVKNCCQLI